MEHEISDLKKQLTEAIESEALTSERVITLSHRLDKLIVEYILKFSGKTVYKHDIDKSQP